MILGGSDNVLLAVLHEQAKRVGRFQLRQDTFCELHGGIVHGTGAAVQGGGGAPRIPCI